jgi:hypothetical protein
MRHAGPDGLLLLGPPTRTANAIASTTPNESRRLSNSTSDMSKRTDELSNQRSRALTVSDRGTGQGSVISLLLANIYLHYPLDLWSVRW